VPAYDYRCGACSHEFEEWHPISVSPARRPCSACGGLAARVLRFPRANPAPFQEHYNLAVGGHVRSRQHFRDELRAASDRASARTGIEHNMVPVDLRDKAELGVTDEGMDATRRHQVATGKVEPKRYV
jgi:putative FmdB family regulatory protein